jgi:hypothetical protein
MGASLLCFLWAYSVRKINLTQHRLLAITGVILNLASSVYLIYCVRYLGLEMPTNFSLPVITTHRLFATAMALLMLAMLFTGLRRMRSLHIKIHRYFLPGYTLTYISGLVLFHR